MDLRPAKTAQSHFGTGCGGRTKAPMRDLVFLAVIVGFFALATLLVAACDRIVGPDPADLDHPVGDDR